MQTFYVFAFLLLTIFIAYQGLCGVLSQLPNFAQVDEAEVFVYPDQGRIVMVLAEGEFYTNGTFIQSGCYRLDHPVKGETRGVASWIWFNCGR